MQASKSRESMPDFDTFQCQACHTTITETKPQKRDDRVESS